MDNKGYYHQLIILLEHTLYKLRWTQQRLPSSIDNYIMVQIVQAKVDNKGYHHQLKISSKIWDWKLYRTKPLETKQYVNSTVLYVSKLHQLILYFNLQLTCVYIMISLYIGKQTISTKFSANPISRNFYFYLYKSLTSDSL